MTDLSNQKKLTNGKGWKFVKNYVKEKKEQITTKVGNIAGGIKETPAIIKRGLKNE